MTSELNNERLRRLQQRVLSDIERRLLQRRLALSTPDDHKDVPQHELDGKTAREVLAEIPPAAPGVEACEPSRDSQG